jgi:hypothetical protein
MQLKEKTKLTISDDSTSEPKSIRFSEEFEDIDTLLLKESITRQESFPIGTHAISLGNIALGKFLYIKPKKDLQVAINGGPAITFRAGKASRLWIAITSLSITTTEVQEVTLFCAGE